MTYIVEKYALVL